MHDSFVSNEESLLQDYPGFKNKVASRGRGGDERANGRKGSAYNYRTSSSPEPEQHPVSPLSILLWNNVNDAEFENKSCCKRGGICTQSFVSTFLSTERCLLPLRFLFSLSDHLSLSFPTLFFYSSTFSSLLLASCLPLIVILLRPEGVAFDKGFRASFPFLLRERFDAR